MAVEKIDSGIRVKRELEDGWFQNVEMALPAVLTIQSGINKLRYATLMGIKKAKSKETRAVTAAPLTARHDEILKVAPPERVKRMEKLTGLPDEIAQKIVEKLKLEVKVL
jgi:electron transfer flavoprotein beta subunit